VVGDRGTPAIQRVALGEVAGLPRVLLGDVVEVVEVLGEGSPGIADIEEEVGADHVPAQTPAGLPAGLLHLARAHGDLVHAAALHRAVGKARAPGGENAPVWWSVVQRRNAMIVWHRSDSFSPSTRV